MAKKTLINPKHGDILWLNVEPHRGKEIGGHNKVNPYRPVLIISSYNFNKIGLIIGIPITSHNHIKGNARKALIQISTDYKVIHGYAALFEIRCYDYQARYPDRNSSRPFLADHLSNRKDWQLINYLLMDAMNLNNFNYLAS